MIALLSVLMSASITSAVGEAAFAPFTVTPASAFRVRSCPLYAPAVPLGTSPAAIEEAPAMTCDQEH